jgi:glycosyltransferase involved in cell wall biosynthesis
MTPGSVSVVIPAHNAARFLAAAVASVRAQTAPAAEIIVVDDGSGDETPAVIAGLGAGVRAFRQPQGGAAAARNRGAELATGEWLAFLDADDLWLPDKLAVQLAWLRARPETDVVFGQGGNFAVAADGHRREEAARPAYLPGAALMRREFFLQRARFDEGLHQSEVIGWYLRLQADGARIGLVPDLVLWRRLHETNLRRQGDGGRAADLRLLREWIQRRRGP